MSRKRYRQEDFGDATAGGGRTGTGQAVGEVCRSLGISEQSYYRWRNESGRLKLDQARRMKDLEKENGRLKKAAAELTLDKQILKEALGKLLRPERRRQCVVRVQ